MLCSFLKASSWTRFAHITKHKWWDLDACLSVQAFSFHVFLAALPAAMTEVLVGIIWSQIAFKTTEQNNPSRLIFQESSAQIQTQVHAYCSPIRHNRSVKICILERDKVIRKCWRTAEHQEQRAFQGQHHLTKDISQLLFCIDSLQAKVM